MRQASSATRSGSIRISINPRAPLQAPGGGDSGGGQPVVPGVNVLDLDHHRRAPGRAGRVTGGLGQSRAGEEHRAGRPRGANSR
jgi:hypothetical protein